MTRPQRTVLSVRFRLFNAYARSLFYSLILPSEEPCFTSSVHVFHVHLQVFYVQVHELAAIIFIDSSTVLSHIFADFGLVKSGSGVTAQCLQPPLV